MSDTDDHGPGDARAELLNDDVDLDDLEFDPAEFAEDGEWWPDDDEEAEPTVHEQALAQWGEKRALVDVEMAPLITEIWRAGLETYSSCQDLGESLAELGRRLPHMARYVEDRQGRAHIDFCPPDAQPFLDMVAASGPAGALYDRMSRWTAVGAWRYDLPMLHMPDGDGTYSFKILAIQVSIPRTDLKAVTRGLRRYNARAERSRSSSRLR